MNQKIEYSSKIIAFIDILGFKEIVTSLPDNPMLHERLDYALKRIKYVKESVNNQNSLNVIYEVSVFLDSIAISNEEDKISELIWTVGLLQSHLLYAGILTRGGISSGLLHHSNEIMYGEGLISVYNLEQKSAVYSRVVVSNTIVSKNYKSLKAWFLQDPDGVYYINLFKFDAVPCNAEELAADGYDPRAIYFKEVRDRLIENRKNSTEENHLSKQQWIIDKFNRAVIDFNGKALDKIALID